MYDENHNADHAGDAAQHEQDEPCRAEQVQRAGSELGPEPEADHVHKALEGALPIVLGHAGRARTVVDHHFADGKAFDFKNCGDKAVHFSVEVHAFETLLAVDFETAAGIVDAVAHDQPAQKVRPAGRKALEERILAVLAPAADHVELVLFEVVDHFGNIGGVVLQISVHGDDIIVLRGVDARVHGGRLAEVAAEADELERSKRLCQFNGFVLGTVVHKNNLVRQTRFF